MNVISYLRVSGATQIAGDGFPRQQAAIEAFCKAQGLTLAASPFAELGVSGTVEGIDRPIFSQAMEFVEHRGEQSVLGHVQAIVVERMDRLARDLMVSELLLKECRTRGIKVFSADQGNLTDMASDGGDPTRVLIRQIMGALAQWEKSVLVRKLRGAKDRLKAAGIVKPGKKCVEGNIAYGRYSGEQPILKLMLDWHAEGHNFSDIARLLASMDCRTRKGRVFTCQNVRMILLNAIKNKRSN